MLSRRNLPFIVLGFAAALCGATEASEDRYAIQTLPLSALTLTTVQQMLLSYIKQRQVALPADVLCGTCLIKGWQQRGGTGHARRFPIGDLQSAMIDYPVQVRDKLRVLLYSSSGSTSFENFAVDIQQTHAVKQSFIGCARRLNDFVEVALVSANIVADLVPKFITLERRECRRILFVKKCKTVSYTEQRGYYATEISAMTTALTSESFKVFAEYATRLT